MKPNTFLWRALPLLLCGLLLFSSCQKSAPDDGADDSKEAELAACLAEIAALQTELQELRETQYITESGYKQQIAALEEQIKTLSTLGGGQDGEQDEQALLHYTITEKGALITGMEGDITLLTIPDKLDGHPVIGIGERAFEGKGLVSVTLPAGLTEIGWFAFYGCEDLLYVTLPYSVSSIGYAVFDGCGSVTLLCQSGSYAEQYAKSYGLKYTARGG